MIFTRANFIALFESIEGTPYLYGGTEPFNGGADCSGAVVWCGEQCGVTLPRTTEAEWDDLVHVADPSLAGSQPGDLVEFEVPGDGGDPPQHVGCILSAGVMVDDPHTGAVVRVEGIPNIPGEITPMGYVKLPFVAEPPPAPPAPPQIPQEIIMGLPTGCTDDGAIYCQIREWYTTYRDDPMAEVNQQILHDLFKLPANEELNGVHGFGGSPDLLLAYIIDQANQQGHLRPQFVNAT